MAQAPLQTDHGIEASAGKSSQRRAFFMEVLDHDPVGGAMQASVGQHAKAGSSAVGEDAIQRFAGIYAVERELAGLNDEERRSRQQALARPLWEQLGTWLQLERRRVADGGSTAAAIDYALKHWTALTHHLEDGAVTIDDNHLERQIKP